MTGALVTAALILGALLLTLVAPRWLARRHALRTSPGPALFLWQAVSLSGVAFALLAAPVAALTVGLDSPTLLGVAIAISVLMVVRLLWSGHRIGSDLRRMRSEHRRLVDLTGQRLEGPHRTRSTVIAHASPTAYCLPGRHDRIVLSQAALDRLDPQELEAVLEHERAHLSARHDLLLELFTVLHFTVPHQIRAPEALQEVHLLVEALADRVAVDRVGAPVLARALVAMATGGGGAGTPGSAGAGRAGPAPAAGTGQVRTRLGLLAADAPRPATRAALVAGGLVVLALPWAVALATL